MSLFNLIKYGIQYWPTIEKVASVAEDINSSGVLDQVSAVLTKNGIDVEKIIAGAATAQKSMTTAEVQAALNQLGQEPPLFVNGVLNPETTAAITEFQTKWMVDGVAGPLTQEALRSALKQ